MQNNNDGLISTERPEVVRVTVKRLDTKNGLGTTRGLRIGDSKLIRPHSVRSLKIINNNGREFSAIVVDEVDETGKYIGWIYYELFVDVA